MGALAHRVLLVVQQAYVDADGAQGVEEGRDRSVAGAGQHGVLAVDDGLHGQGVDAVGVGRGLAGADLDTAPRVAGVGQVLVLEDRPDVLRRDLAALGVGLRLDDLRELDLHPAGQVQLVVVLQDVRDAALAGLRVDADDGLVGAADVLRVDRQVRHRPLQVVDGDALGLRVGLHGVEALLDGVLVGAGEGRVDQVAHVRVARVDLHLVAVLPRTADLVDVGEVDLRVDALREQVHAQGDQVDVAGALALPEQTALDPVGAGHQGQFGGGDGGAAVVVRVDRQADVLAAGQVAAHPLEAVGVRGGGRTLHRGGQVEDDLAARAGLPDVHDRLADLQREVQLGVGEDLRAVLVAKRRAISLGAQQFLGVLHHQAGAVDGDLLDVVLGAAEDHPAEHRGGGVVEVHHGAPGALQGLDGPLDQVLTGLGQHGDRHVVRDRALFLDDGAHEVEVGLAGGREADLDLLVAHRDQLVEHPALALGRHRVDQGLVAVAQVGGEPAGGDGDPVVRPGAVRDVHLLVPAVLVDRHGTGLLAVRHGA